MRPFGRACANTKEAALRRVPLFRELRRAELRALARAAEEVDVPSGKVLCREGGSAHEFFVILEGDVAVTKGGELVRTVRGGDFFGEMALVEHVPRAVTVTAITPARVFAFASRAFWGVICRNPKVERRLLRSLIVENISVRTIAESKLAYQAELNDYQALHDSLTALPNRTLFRDRISNAISLARRDGSGFAVLMVDLDRFKDVNDTLGHSAGDELLMEVAGRLQRTVRESDTVARLGGDEFGLLLPTQDESAEVVTAIARVRDTIEQPLMLEGLPIAVAASIGVSLFPHDGADVDTLLQRADVAMYLAKEDRSGYAFYDASTDQHSRARLRLVGDLQRALRERELVLYYQPKASLKNWEVDSVEALVRWIRPDGEIVLPDEFIPVAERTGLIEPLTIYVIDEALRECKGWQDEGLSLSVAVNISGRNLLAEDFPGDVDRLLREHGIAPELLTLEITESTMLTEPVRTRAVLDTLSAMGVRLSVDDFGTGFSSLAHLKRLPLDEIKVDRSFVGNMLSDEDDAVIVRSTIELGRSLGLQVVAEGVEDEQTWRELATLGCDRAQGYYLSRAVPPASLVRLLREWTRRLRSVA